ncbi:MAG: PD-(D/E)XK nuclease family protein, partial [Chthoniobacteraceae bacterium]
IERALGHRFRTREFLRQGLEVPETTASRAQMRLLLSAAASVVAERTRDEEIKKAATAVASAPDHLLRAMELLGSGGWNFPQAGPAALRPIAEEFDRLLIRCGFNSASILDATLRRKAAATVPLFRALLITGFDGAHWPWWRLLEAAARSASDLSVLLREPQDAAGDLDMIWIGTWEQEFGASQSIATQPVTPIEKHEFFIGADTREQARAVAQKALQFLADPHCDRLGILLPGPGALARQVAEILAEFALPHFDGIAHVTPGPFESAERPAWLGYQLSPRLPALLRLLEVSPGVAALFGGLPAAVIADQLRRAQTDILLDDLEVITAWLRQHSPSRHAEVLANGLAQLSPLPDQNVPSQFLAATTAAFTRLGWNPHAGEMMRAADDWIDRFDVPVSRQAWLRWLEDTLESNRSNRAATGNHPYSRTHLLSYSGAGAQAWTHLIVAGLNEAQWPPPVEESGWIGEREIEELNRNVRHLNARATRTGRQGEGHEAVKPGHALCLGPAQRRALAERDFFSAVAATTHAVAAMAGLTNEATPERSLNPSDFFNRLHHHATGRIISHDGLSAIRRQTADWLESANLWPSPQVERAAVSQTRIAYDARRKAGTPFGEYEFALREPAREIRLSATDWEHALAQPSLIWMKSLLGVRNAETEIDSTIWKLAIGQWTHRWLGTMSTARGGFAPRGEHAAANARVMKSALDFRRDFESLLRASGRPQPDWWTSVWQQAARMANLLADRLAEAGDHTHLATEWSFGSTAIALDDDRRLHLRGRMDLILANALAEGGAFPTKVWIIDYKTGGKSSLAPKEKLEGVARRAALAARLRKGDGLQLALYALAAHHFGATTIGVSLLTPELELTAPQLTLEDLAPAAQEQLWSGLHRMQESGVFGMRGPLRDEFSFGNPHPLATLAIDPGLLAEKWERTHPGLAGVEEDLEGSDE